MTEKLKIYGKKFALFFVVIPLILWMLLSAGVAIAKYVTQKNVTSGLNVSITVANGYTISSSKLQTALKTLKSSSPTTLKFVTGDSSELTGLTCISAASSGVQDSGSKEIGVFQSSDGKTIYVAPMNADGTPADNEETMAAPENSSDLLSASKTGLTTLTSISCANLDTSKVTSMNKMFFNNANLTSLDLSNFDTSKVTNFTSMFSACRSLTSLDVTNFDTSSATNMSYMFNNTALASLDVSKFNTSNVQNFSYMFGRCESLTSLNLSNFDTSSATTMCSMFNNNTALTSLNLSNFDTSKVTDFSLMFSECRSLTSLDVTNFDTSSATNMSSMFTNNTALSALDLSSFDTSKVKNMSKMFYGDSNLSSIYASDTFVTNNVTSSDGMFTNCTSLVGGAGTAYDSSHIDKEYARLDGGPTSDTPGYFQEKTYNYSINASKLQAALNALSDDSPTALNFVKGNSSEIQGLTCISAASDGIQDDGLEDKIGVFQSVDGKTIYIAPMKADGTPAKNNATMAAPENSSGLLSKWNIPSILNYTSISCTNLDTSYVTNMEGMFYSDDSGNLTSLDVSSFNTENVTRFATMFYYCDKLTQLNLSNFNTSNAYGFDSMFYRCSSLTTLDVSSFNTSNAFNFYAMFSECANLKTIYASNTFVLDNATTSDGMFYNDTNLVGGAGTTYDSSHVDKEYARIDGGPSSTTPGYFTGSTSSANSISVASIINEAVKVSKASEDEVSESSEINLDSSSSESGAIIDESTDSLLKNEDSNESSSSDSDISSGVYSSLVALKESVVG